LNHLPTIEGMSGGGISATLDDIDGFVEVLPDPIPKVPALRGESLTTARLERSTRTRLSCEKGVTGPSADTMPLSPRALRQGGITLENCAAAQ